MKQLTSITNSTKLDFAYNVQHLKKATLDFSKVIRLVNSRKNVLNHLES